MNVLQINSTYQSGSTGRIVSDISEILLKNNHNSYAAYGRGTKKMVSNRIIRIGNKYDNLIHLIFSRLFDNHGFSSKKATKKFIKKIKKLDIDIIHLHNIHGYYINYEMLFKFLKEINKPVVWTLHDCWAFTGHCSYFDFVKCNKWQTECNTCPLKKEYPKSIFIDNSRNNFNFKKIIFNSLKNLTIVTPSKWLKGLVEMSFLKKFDSKTINNGIDLQIFKPTDSNFRIKHKLDHKRVVLGIANVWDKRKGLKFLIELSQKLSSKFKIVIVGLNKKQLKNLPKNILGFKKTNNIKELVEIYSASDIFINPTLEDNFPTTNIEALACGIPVITFNSGGSAEMLNEKCGIVCNEKTSNCLKENILRIDGANINPRDCIEQAKKYNKDDKFKEYVNLYSNKIQKIKRVEK